ncbi:Follicular epithelium yolk protein subunit [Operophtera brumata]|uniref:Follicular epithelium yolk protein subunit n=1 Tax=Operophtera brumata TaxID=104452 RepID=A0A0L7LDS0_OPEBR|nr:Follicular epithelium yolk protein subunit [Operophtera brumata]
MKKLTILAVILTVCSAKINIYIKTSDYLNKTEVKHTGRDIKLVTDEEVALFNITHANLNRGIRIEMGKIPDDIYLRDPTPFQDLFKEFEWPQVERVLSIKSAKIEEFMKDNIVIKTHEHINNTSLSIQSKTDMMEMVENTVLSIWSTNGLPKDLINYGVNIDFGNGNWSFNDTWRDETLKSVQLPFGASKGLVHLKSGQTIVSKLTGNKIVMLIEVEYIAKLVGNIIADYDRLYGKYHFYSPALLNIMRAANLKNEVVTTEFLEVRFYTNPKVEVFDTDTGEELNVELKKLCCRRPQFGDSGHHHGVVDDPHNSE